MANSTLSWEAAWTILAQSRARATTSPEVPGETRNLHASYSKKRKTKQVSNQRYSHYTHWVKGGVGFRADVNELMKEASKYPRRGQMHCFGL